jgi:hypothetical protein
MLGGRGALLAVLFPVTGMACAPFTRTVPAHFAVFRIGGDLLSVVIGAALSLAPGFAADCLSRLELRWLENLLAVTTTPFTHRGVVASRCRRFRNSCRVSTASPPMAVVCLYLAKSACANGAVPKVPRTVRYFSMISSIERNVHVSCTDPFALSRLQIAFGIPKEDPPKISFDSAAVHDHNCLWRHPSRLCQLPFGQVPCLTDCCHDHRYQSTGFGDGRPKLALDANSRPQNRRNCGRFSPAMTL